MRKFVFTALAGLCALLALPAFTSATPAHLDKVPENGFTVHGGALSMTQLEGATVTGTTTTGSGTFENTTTGTVNLTFHGVKAESTFNCTTVGQPTGTVVTTALPFHLIMLETNVPGVLITGKPTAPKTETDHISSSNCGIFVGNLVIKGTGLIGTITSPKCGESSTTATLRFDAEAHGMQRHRTWTGSTYDLKASVGGTGWKTFAIETHATISFVGGPRTLVCTH